MGLMDKLRDMFTEEVDDYEEKEIKSEVIQVEIPAPQQKEEQPIVEKTKEEKVQQPIFFDDNDFANLEPPKPKINKTIERQQKRTQEVKEKKEEKKVFKPTPIISPVYGVLDKNYHKEDIKQKNNSVNNAYYSNKEVSIDDIRKKAYGTLEDDLEVTLFGEKTNDPIETEEIDMFDELMEDANSSKTDESDLFNLIDSMYEKEGDNNGSSK